MKVILSRKGFDSSNGGLVSPIFEDRTMVSFPIPSHDLDTYGDLQYCGIPYKEILADLKYKGGSFCHVDPDLDQERRMIKIDGWEPAAGVFYAGIWQELALAESAECEKWARKVVLGV